MFYYLGQFNKIPDRYSQDLSEIVKMMVQVQADARPSCGNYLNNNYLDEILKHPIVLKRLEFFKSATGQEGDMNEDTQLLQTIRIPKNLLFLTDRLPQANYEKITTTKKNLSFQNNNLPDIKKPTSKRNKEKMEKGEIKEIKDIRLASEVIPLASEKNLNEATKDIDPSKKHSHSTVPDEIGKRKKVNELEKSIDYDKTPNIKVVKNLDELNNSIGAINDKESKKQIVNNDMKLPSIKNVNIDKYEQPSPRRK